VPEEAWATKVRLGSARLIGARGRGVPWLLLDALVNLGLIGGLGNGRSPPYTTCRRVVDLVAIR
jgi:hypothetical protein